MTVRNELVWDKENIAGMASPELTQYPEASERCLFLQLGRFLFQVNQTKDDYWQGWEPIRSWMVEQRDAAGFKATDIRRITGTHMNGHWFSQSQWTVIDRKNYAKLAEAAEGRAFTRAFADLRAEYDRTYAVFCDAVRDGRREEFDAERPHFDNAHDSMYDVWHFERVHGDERHGHATPKPVAMVERAILSSSKPGAIVLAPFSGSGSDIIAAERTGRRCFAVELQGAYVDVSVARWQTFTGERAVHADSGVPFPQEKV